MTQKSIKTLGAFLLILSSISSVHGALKPLTWGFYTKDKKLAWYVKDGNIDKVKKYLKNGASLAANGLHVAALKNHTDIVQYFIEEQIVVVDARDSKNKTPLNKVAKVENRTEMMTLLLSHGADPNISDYKGNTPLHNAIRKKRFGNIYTLLTVENLKLDTPNNKGLTPVVYAQKQHYKMVALAELAKKTATIAGGAAGLATTIAAFLAAGITGGMSQLLSPIAQPVAHVAAQTPGIILSKLAEKKAAEWLEIIEIFGEEPKTSIDA